MNPPHCPVRSWGRRYSSVCHVREVPLARQVDEFAVEVPRPSVERTAQLRAVAGGGRRLQLGAAVQAGVVERPDRAVRSTHHDGRPVTDVVDVVVARLRDVFLATCPLPGTRPHVLVLGCGVARRGELLVRHIGVTFELVRLHQQLRGRRRRVAEDEIPCARAGAARLAGSQRDGGDGVAHGVVLLIVEGRVVRIIGVCSRANGTIGSRISWSSTMLPSGSRP